MRLIIVIATLILFSFPVFADKKFNKNQQLELAYYVKNKIYEVCEVQQDYRLFHEAYDDGNTMPTNVATINLFKGKYIGVTKSNWRNFKQYVNNGALWPEKNIFNKDGSYNDKIRHSNVFDKKTYNELLKCYKNKIKRIKIKFPTWNIFTQNDLFTGLEDNEKHTGYGFIEVPKYKHCKSIEKLPVMFLMHHSGGKIFPSYKWQLHQMCIATFEPYVYRSRGNENNFFEELEDIQWITETQGAVDALQALDVVAKLPYVDADRIGIMGWSYGGVVTIETQNMFNIKALGTENRFALHLAYYPYCYHYDDVDTTDSPLMIMSAGMDTIAPSHCTERIEKISNATNNKKHIIFEKATHNFDGDNVEAGAVSAVSDECRIHIDSNGNETVRTNNKEEWFDITANGGWFGGKNDPLAIKKVQKLCWNMEQAVYVPDPDAYKQSQVIFLDYVNKYLGGNNDK